MSKVLTVLFLFMLVACSSKVEEQLGNSTQDSFSVGEISMGSVESTPLSAEWKDIPQAIHLNLKTCLTEKILFRPLMNEQIEISGDGTRAVVLADVGGCVSWKESLSFDFFKKEQPIEINKIITGMGIHKGSVSIPISINPWAGDKVFKDLRYDKEVTATISYNSFLKDTVASSEAALYVQGLAIVYQEDSIKDKKLSHKYRLQADLRLRRRGRHDEFIYKEVNSGKYKVSVQLFRRIRKDDKFLIIADDEKVIIQKARKLEGDITLTFAEKYGYNDAYQISLTFEPIDLKDKISPVTVLMPIQNFTNFHTGSLQHIEKSELEKRIVRSVEKQLIEKFSKYPENEIGFTISHTDFEKGPVATPTFTGGSLRTRMLDVKMTLLNPTNGSRIDYANFKISLVDQNNPEKVIFLQNSTTTMWGSIEAQVPVEYDIYGNHEWLPVTVEVEGLDERYLGIKERRHIAFNPWMEGGKNSFDLHRVKPPEVEQVTAPKIILGDISYQNRGNVDSSYLINSNLNLSLKKQYQVKINPKIQLPHSYSGEFPAQPIVFGDYQLEIAIFLPTAQDLDEEVLDIKKMHLIAVTSKKVTVKQNSDIETMIELPFWISEVGKLSYKLVGVVQLKPLDPKTRLQPAIESFPFFGLSNGGSFSTHFIKEMDQETKDLLANIGTSPLLNKVPKAVKENSLEKIKADANVESFKMSELNARDPLRKGVWNKAKNRNYERFYSQLLDADLRMLTSETAKMPNSVVKLLCRHLYELPSIEESYANGQVVLKEVGGENFKECQKNPSEYVEARAVQHVLQILGKQRATIVPGVEVKQASLIEGMSYAASSGERDYFGTSESSSISKKVSWNMDIKPPLLFDFSMGKTASWEVGETAQKGKSSGADSSFSVNTSNISLSYDRLVLGFNAEVLDCVLVQSKKSTLKPLHICREQSRPSQIREKWFFVGKTDSRNHSVLTDATEIGDGEFNQLVRGEVEFNRLWAKFKDNKSKLMLRKIKSSNFMEKTIFEEQEKEEFALFDNAIPGVIFP